MVIIIGLANPCRSQSDGRKAEAPKDTVLKDRTKLSMELTQLRDSINAELALIAQMNDTSSIIRPYIERAKKKLSIQRNKVGEVIEDVGEATKETWDYFVMEAAHCTVI